MEIFFYKGAEDILKNKKELGEDSSHESVLKKIQDSFLKVLDNKNLSFLLGSGCSSYKIESESFKEIGIPVMDPLAKEFYSLPEFKEQIEWLKTELSIDVSQLNFATNLETFLSTLHSLSFYHSKTSETKKDDKSIKKFSELAVAEKIDHIIIQARDFLLEKCLNFENSKTEKDKDSIDKPLIELYKQFFRKLLSRNSTLPRLNIFTTNYDLYSERAMDLLGIHYVNGFTGGSVNFSILQFLTTL